MKQSQKVKISLGTFNLAKGIGILCIICAHMTTRYSLERVPQLLPMYLFLQVTASGLLPMFFIISGYQFKAKSAKVMLKKSFSELLVPYLWGGLGCYVFYLALNWPFLELDDLWYCSQLLSAGFLLGLPAPKEIMGNGIFSAQALWFFMAMFVAFNLLNLILKVGKQAVQILLVIICAGIGYLLLKLDFNYYCIPQGMMATGFCYAGYMIRQKKLLDPIMTSVWTYVVLIPVYLLMTVYGMFDLAAGDFSILEYLGAFGAGVLYILIGILCSKFTWKGLDWIKKIGMYSYWILCIHGAEMLVVPYYELVAALSGYTPLLAFFLEIGLKIVILSTGCMILKKISQNNYNKKKITLMKNNNYCGGSNES